ncbi:MAG: 4Fe-4S dicluster domain-containing protein [Desulfovibrio sp.]|nr:4Fe-4S dicluster domain-containing protein [Desulfovibrio sp.]
MDQDSLRAFESRCTQESPPRCRAACPFDLDCRTFLARMAEGKQDEARKLLDRHLPLPHVLVRLCDHPCENTCLRRDLGGSVALHGLELACLLNTDSQERLLPLPPKRYRMAIVGAGLAGLAAAWDLARKAYPVVLFHEGSIEDTLLIRFPQLRQCPSGKDFLAQDIGTLTRRKARFQRVDIDNGLLERLAAEFDSVLLDADAAAVLVPEESRVDASTLLWKDNICCAGWPGHTPTGHPLALPSRQAGQGRYAAQTMERLVAHISLTAERTKVQGPLRTEVSGITPVQRVEPGVITQDGEELFNSQEAVAEAGRCLQCECLICVRQCAYMQKFKGYPRLYARQAHNNAAIVKGLHTANSLVNGCALCGQCAELCPENFSMAELCLAAREDMVARGVMPPSAHEFALEDMENASGPECFLALPDPDMPDRPAWLFFPGCQLAASRGEQVKTLYDWLRATLNAKGLGVALMLSCCGMPARWAGRQRLFQEHMKRLHDSWKEMGRPRILTACASCLTALREGLPEAETFSVWEIMDGLDITSLLAESQANTATFASMPPVFSMHDPCNARYDAAWLASVRNLARKADAVVEDPPLSGATTACCGYGGLVWCAQSDTADAMAAHRAAQLPHPILASCIMCRDRLAASGKECWHLLDVLLPGMAQHSGNEPGPGLSARRANRASLRRRLLARTGAIVPEIAPPPCNLRIPQQLLTKLEKRHILLTDAESAVAGAEATSQWFENMDNGHRLGSWRPRNVTFWVEYSKEDGGYTLYDAWCHRMIVPGSGGQEAHEVIAAQQCCTDGGRRKQP